MFNLATRTSWQKEPTRMQMSDMVNAIYPYPLIERAFFDDLTENCRKNGNYQVEMGLMQVINQEKKNLDPDLWILIWGKDFRDREFQLLIERHPDFGGKGAIAAVGPADFFEYLSGMKQKALPATLTLLNEPSKMKAVYVVVSRPKSYQERSKDQSDMQAFARFKNWIEVLKQTPNKDGQWFPSNAPQCPLCGSPVVGIADEYRVGFGTLICPECGHSERKMIGKKREFEKSL